MIACVIFDAGNENCWEFKEICQIGRTHSHEQKILYGIYIELSQSNRDNAPYRHTKYIGILLT